MSKLPYNCYIDHKGYLIPKSPVIKCTKDIIEWLSTDDTVRFLFNDRPNTLNIEKEWLVIGIGHSYIGNIYANATGFTYTQEEFDKFFLNNPYMKIFDEDYEAFKKYMKWVAKLGPWFTTRKKFNKK